MVDPVVVAAPTLWPNACVQCRSATGPLVDTSVETKVGDRIYVCASCVRRDAIALGLLEGDRSSELLGAVEREAEAHRALARMTDRARATDIENENLKAELIEAVDARDWLVQRNKQLEDAITQDARARLMIVGSDAA